MPSKQNVQIDFDIAALFEGLDSQRRNRALSWQGVAQELWDQSAALNKRRNDHPMSASTLTSMAKRRDTTCHLRFSCFAGWAAHQRAHARIDG
jgi:hypothetical protein